MLSERKGLFPFFMNLAESIRQNEANEKKRPERMMAMNSFNISVKNRNDHLNNLDLYLLR